MKTFPSPRPWVRHATGSHLGIRDATGKFVIRKVVSQLSLQECHQLDANFELIVRQVNAATDEQGEAKEPQ